MVPFLRSSVLWLWLPLLSNMIDASPADRADVMALEWTAIDLYCNRHCWNRKPCTSYSFDFSRNGPDNCVLHAAVLATSADPTPASDGPWHTIQATNSSDSKCKTRPCQEWAKCVAPMEGNWYYCTEPTLPQCSRKPAVPHASVSVTGWPHQGDKAMVSCDEPYVMSPKNASTEITCQGTSQWTPFEGECVPYEFYPGGISSFERDLPRPLEDSEICVEGMITEKGHVYVDLMSSLSATLIDFRIIIFTWWTTSLQWTQNYPRGSDEYKKSYLIRNLNMRVGDTIRLSINLWYGLVRVAETNTGGGGLVPNHAWNSYNITQSKAIAVSGLINITYINLLSGC